MTQNNTLKVLVTGAAGQVGSELTMELRRRYGNDNVIAAGHPIGAITARLRTTLLYEMKQRRSQYGLVPMCINSDERISMAVKGV